MLLTCTVLLPFPDGADPRRLRIEARALALFGGYTWLTSEASEGGWVDDFGEVHLDSLTPLTVCIDTLGDLALVVALAREAGRILGETSVHVRCLGWAENVMVAS